MEIIIRNQNKALILSILLGLFIGILYDAFKLSRKLVLPQKSSKCLFKKSKGEFSMQIEKPPKSPLKIRDLVVVALFDLLFCLLLCPIFCVFTYIMVNGRFRWFIFVGAFLGALLYKGTLGHGIGVLIDCISYLFFRFRNFLFNKIKIPLQKLSVKIKNSREAKRKKRKGNRQKKARTVVFSYGKSG